MHSIKFIIFSCTMAFISVLLHPEFLPAAEPANIPVKGMVTMVDLGANSCIPCKLMAPILKEVRSEYKERASIIFIDVWKDPSQSKKFGVRVIPTQIFYDKSGKEVWRHEGFMDKVSITEKLKMLLAE